MKERDFNMRIKRNGFTLIETAIVITVIGLIIAGFSLAFRIYQVEQQETVLDDTYDTVRSALNAYIIEDADGNPATPGIRANYPCPASLTMGPADVNYGSEMRADATTCVSGAGTGIYEVGNVYIGAVPARDLRINAGNMLDVYKTSLHMPYSKIWLRKMP